MKRISTIIISIIAAIATFTSCKSDDTLRYNNLTMGNVVDGTFISDQGNIFTVVETNCSGDLESMKRAIILCDVLKLVEGTENEYEIRLNNMAQVLAKDPVSLIEAEKDPEKTVEDPIHIEQLWISGGYLNMYLMYKTTQGSTKKHLVNLVFDEEASKEGKYYFTLRHNAFGDTSTTGNMLLGGAYVSFPIASLISEDSAEITVDCKWYKSTGMGWDSEIQDNEYKLTYTKGGFEHAPVSLSNMVKTNLN